MGFIQSFIDRYRQKKQKKNDACDALIKKIDSAKDVMNVTRDEDGITTMSIYDFLLKENSLEL